VKSHADSEGDDRKTLITKHADLTKTLERLRIELAAYSEHDPVEMEKKADETKRARFDADKFTDHILSMESWLKENLGGDREALLQVQRGLYGDEFDEEERGLRELWV
jgi:hypothetical protein